MAGVPLQYPNDAKKYREAYIANLALQQELNAKNYTAVSTFKRTGVVPSVQTDFRSTSEKLADIENLRNLVRSGLKDIADTVNAEDISRELSADEVQYVAQHIAQLVKDLKPRYKLGVPKDIFLQYVKQSMEAGFKNLLGQNGLVPEIDNLKTFDSLRDAFNEILKIAKANNTAFYKTLSGNFDELLATIPTQNDLNRIDAVPDPIVKAEIIRVLGNINDLIPSIEQLETLIFKMKRAVKLNDRNELNSLFNQTNILVEMDLTTKEMIDNILDELDRQVPQAPTTPISAQAPATPLSQGQTLMAEALTPVEAVPYIGLFELPTEKEIQETNMKSPNLNNIRAKLAPFIAYRNTKKEGLIKTDKRAPFKSNYLIVSELGGPGTGLSWDNYIKPLILSNYATLKAFADEQGQPATVNPILGKGIHLKGKDIERYAQLGRYLVNLDKLNDEQISLHRSVGKSVSQFKPQKISPLSTTILKKLLTQQKPSFDELNALTDSDKRILHKIMKSTRIKADIPESTSQREDLNQFEIMKGQIMSGNDSKEMIQRFKVLMIKLSHQGLLPNGQVKDLLIDLVHLGY